MRSLSRRTDVVEAEPDPAPGPGKGKVTPKRTQARAARAVERKGGGAGQSKKERSATRREQLAQARASLNSTDVSKLPAAERLPELVALRDHIDSRFWPGQLAIPYAILYFFTTTLVPPPYGVPITLALVLTLAVALGQTLFSLRRLKRRLRRHFPDSRHPLIMYGFRRVISPRRLRRPVPRVRRGDRVTPLD